MWSVTSWDSPAESTCDYFQLHCQAGGWDLTGHIVFMDGGYTLLSSKAPPCLVFGACAISVHCEILWFAIFLNEQLDLWICFACWPFSTVPSQVFWQECLIEVLESVWVHFPPFSSASCGICSIDSSVWPLLLILQFSHGSVAAVWSCWLQNWCNRGCFTCSVADWQQLSDLSGSRTGVT